MAAMRAQPRLWRTGLPLKRAHGFAPTLAPMDRFADDIPRNGAVIVVTASYEGQPPDNARQFVPAIGNTDSLRDLRFAVFGCGNKQWAHTWQAIPKRVDAALEKAGAQRVWERGVKAIPAGISSRLR